MKTLLLTLEGRTHKVVVNDNGSLTVDGDVVAFDVHPFGESFYSVLVRGQSIPVVARRIDGRYEVLVRNRHRIVTVETERSLLMKRWRSTVEQSASHVEIRAPMPALVVRVEVGPGDIVTEGQGLITLEAMKMENEIRSGRPGKVRRVLVEKGQAVEKNQLLIELE
jgi:biotin carboxyl carrier protein